MLRLLTFKNLVTEHHTIHTFRVTGTELLLSAGILSLAISSNSLIVSAPAVGFVAKLDSPKTKCYETACHLKYLSLRLYLALFHARAHLPKQDFPSQENERM